MQAIDNKKSEWESSTFRGDYADAKRQSIEFINYKTSLKRTWVADKRDIDTLLGNIQTKLKTYELKPYHPPPGLTLQVSLVSHARIPSLSLTFLLPWICCATSQMHILTKMLFMSICFFCNRIWTISGRNFWTLRRRDTVSSMPKSESKRRVCCG